MRIFTKSLLAFVLLCIAGVASAASTESLLASIDYSTQQSYGWYHQDWMRSGDAAVPTVENGALVLNTGENGSYSNVYILDWFAIQAGNDYRAVLKYKTQTTGSFNVFLGGWGDGLTKTVDLVASDDWQEVNLPLGTSPISGGLYSVCLKIFSNFQGIVNIEKVELYETAKEVVWKDIIVNGDMESKDNQCFYVTEPAVGGPFLAPFTKKVGKDGSSCVVIKSAKREITGQNDNGEDVWSGTDWDTQFFIRMPYEIPAGTPFKLSFDYKASVEGSADTQAQNEPGQYIHWSCAGSPNFTTEWQTYEATGSVPGECNGEMADGGYLKNFQTIAFNLAKNKTATEFLIDNIKFEIDEEVLNKLTADPAVDAKPYPVKPDEPAVLDPAIDDSDPAVVANKAALLTAINKAKAADLTNKTSASKKALADAIAAGEEQLASKNTTLAKIDAARRAILQALDELEDRSAPAAEKAVPEGWKSVITNGNLEGDDMSCFFSKTSAGAPEPSVTVDGEGIDDWHAIVINSTASGASQDWDDQFFIRATEVIPAGTKFHVEFDYRSDVEAGADTQCHVEPGNYIHWACIGSPTFKDEWQHFTFDGKAPSETAGKNFQTIAFNLSKNRKDTKLVIDNIVFWVEKPAPVEIEWKDVINNGNMEGTDVSNFVSKVAPSTDIVAATLTAGAGKDGGKGIKLEIPAKVENPWDSQFWIVLPFAVTDEKMKLEFDYKADRAITVDMQNHEAPGSYKGNLGSVNFTTEWQHFSSETFMTGQSIAFNLSMDEAATYFFDNVKLYLDKTIIATGIENVKTILNNGQIFDLQGRRVAQPAKGLYIKNGKKVLVK